MLTKEQVFVALYQGLWPEELLGEDFIYVVDRVLSKNERQILEHKVEGYTDGFIARLFRMQRASLVSRLQEIILKLENQMTVRVDDSVRRLNYRIKERPRTRASTRGR